MTDSSNAHYVILGAGQAGAEIAASLRKKGFEGRITLVGEEAQPPYRRPPLSKAFLAGDAEEASLFVLKPEQQEKQRNRRQEQDR